MVCKKCGAVVTGKYCSECGKKVTSPLSDYIRIVAKRGRKYVNSKWQNYEMTGERYTANLCWDVSKAKFEKTDAYERIFNNNYSGDLEHIAEQIATEAEKLYQQILPLVKAS